MIDSHMRRRLAEDLRHLVTGTITNDEYDDRYCDYCRSTDSAVVEIGHEGWCLYSDTHCYRLRGRYAVDPATKRTVARAILFLHSGLEYQWPERPSIVGFRAAYALAKMGIPAGIAVLICWLPMLVTGLKHVEFMHPIGVLCTVWLAWSIWYLRTSTSHLYQSPEWKARRAAGDFDVWPFLRREEFYEARRTPRCLSGVTPTVDVSL